MFNVLISLATEIAAIKLKQLFKKYNQQQIDKLLKQKRNARRLWQQYRSPKYRTFLAKCTNDLKSALKERKQRSLDWFLFNLTSTKKLIDYSLWKATKHLKRQTKHESAIRLYNGDWAGSDVEKGNLFVKHLKKQFTPNKANILNILPTLNLNPLTNPLIFKIKNIIKIIKDLGAKKP